MTSTELLRTMLSITAGFLDQCPVASSQDIKVLVPLLLSRAEELPIDEHLTESLSTLHRYEAIISEPSLPSAGRRTLAVILEELWLLLHRDRDKGRMCTTDAELHAVSLITEAGTVILRDGRIDDQCLSYLNFNHERMENENFYTSILKVLIIAATSLEVRIFLISAGLSEMLTDQLTDCQIDDEVVLDEKYFLVAHLRTLVGGVGGPGEQRLPDLRNPLEDSRLDRATKAGSPILKQFVQLTHWLDNKQAVFDLGWLEETKALLRNLLISTNYQVENLTILTILEGVSNSYSSDRCPVPESFSRENIQHLIDLLHDYSSKVLELQIEKNTFHEVIKSCDKLSPSLCLTLLLASSGNLSLTRDLISSLASPSRTWTMLGNTGLAGECVEWILREEMPRTFVKLANCGVSPAALAAVWVEQAFLAVLDFQVNILCVQEVVTHFI